MSSQHEIRQAFGRRLTARREAADLRQADLARLAGVSDAYISQIEAGQRMPTLSVIHQLADALGCRAVDLIDDDQTDTYVDVEAVS